VNKDLLKLAKKILNIDKNRLDEEWVDQPRLRHAFHEALADANAAAERAEARIKLTDAELDREIRLSPSEFDFEGKPTEPAIKATILGHGRHQEAFEAWVHAKHEVDTLTACIKAIDDRKYALQDLVRLKLANYFGDPVLKDHEVGRR
jgi:hypothetical protein